jgi:hypothetical protein
MLQTARRPSLVGRQGLQQPGHLGRVGVLQQLADTLEPAGAQGVAHGLQVADRVLAPGARRGGVRLGEERLAGGVLGRLTAQALAQARAQVLQDGRFAIGIHLLPERVPALVVQALEEGGDLGRVQARDKLADALVAPLGQRLDDAFAVGDRVTHCISGRGSRGVRRHGDDASVSIDVEPQARGRGGVAVVPGWTPCRWP